MVSVGRAIRNDSLLVDAVACAATGGILLACNAHQIGKFVDHAGTYRGSLYQLEAQVIAAILGFLIAAAAILGSAVGIQRLRVERYDMYKRLIGSFRSSMIVSLVALVYSVVAYIADQDANSKAYYVIVGLILFFLVSLRVARSVRRLYQSLSL